MSTSLTLLQMDIEELLETINMFPISKREKAMKLTNKVIKSLLQEYCENSEYFEAVSVAGQSTIKYGYYGLYAEGHITIDSTLLDFVNNYKQEMTNDYGDETTKLEIGINTYLHESRHAKQFADKMSMCKDEYNSNNYFMHPMEVDARTYAELYIHEAADYIMEHLMDRVIPQYQSLLGM